MSDSEMQPAPLERLPSQIAGLDTILRGGFLQGGIYIVMGQPGTGKTILGNQICFGHVQRGGRALFATLLAESHGRMFSHLQAFRFFSTKPIPDRLYYISAYSALESDGLPGLIGLLRSEIRERQASVLVIDGLVTAEAISATNVTFKKFIHELQVLVGLVGCTCFLLTNSCLGELAPPEHTMVDGIIELTDNLTGPRAVRGLEVKKFRGSPHLRGRHSFEITDEGIMVHPRLEALLANPTRVAGDNRTRVPLGVSRLDEMLQGGVLSGSTTLLLGDSGVGKTVLGLQFLTAGAAAGEPGLYFGFYETPARLVGTADQLGLGLSAHIAAGRIEVLWQAPVEQLQDALAARLLQTVRQRGIRRLFVDGLAGLRESSTYPERISGFFTALTNELRGMDVTTMFSQETRTMFGPQITLPITDISAIVENTLLMRHVELRSQIFHLISILKVRESGYDPAIREFKITDGGIEIADNFDSAEMILTGLSLPGGAGGEGRMHGGSMPRGHGR